MADKCFRKKVKQLSLSLGLWAVHAGMGLLRIPTDIHFISLSVLTIFYIYIKKMIIFFYSLKHYSAAMQTRIKVTSPESLGASLRALRKDKGLNQTEAGKPAGVNQVTVSSIERGVPTRVDTLFRLLAALDLELVIQPREKPDEDAW